MIVYPSGVNPVVYLSAEFAIDSELPTYAGGLGVLAGDIVKEAADRDMPMIGIGILYKGKHFVQHITGDGKEEKRDTQFDHDTSFLKKTEKNGRPIEAIIKLKDQEIKVRSYHLRVSERTLMIFLSTDVDDNPPEWVSDMDALYQGDTDSQIRQQILLGVGGSLILDALNIKPSVYHLNEGRPGFIFWELIRKELENGNDFEQAKEIVKKRIVYTNHTLVSAGNLEHPMDKVYDWTKKYTDVHNINAENMVSFGEKDGKFSITKYALEISSKHFSVSKIHEKCAKEAWPNYEWNYITNGVHMSTWQDSDFRNPNITNEALWDLHMKKKMELERTVRERTGYGYDYNRLVVSWARRLAIYKQPFAIFEDIERLKKLVSNQEMPIQILYAGNSHGADKSAKGIVEEAIRIMSSDLAGHAIFVPNYNTSLSNHLVSGSDVWLNTPMGNLEACGTSGMKAAANGVINCTVIDGWTNEVDWNGVGWILNPQNVSDSIYTTFEDEISPLYYDRTNGLPLRWIGRMRKSIAISKEFSTSRVLDEYERKLYNTHNSSKL